MILNTERKVFFIHQMSEKEGGGGGSEGVSEAAYYSTGIFDIFNICINI